MKFTKLFTAALCGSMLLASCSFDGTKGTFEEDLKAKYENNDTVEIVKDSNGKGKVAALTLTWTDFYSTTDDDGKVIKWTAKVTSNYSLASVDGIGMFAISGSDEKTPLALSNYPCTIQFAESDTSKKTVEIIVAAEDYPEDYLVKADATVVKAVNGAMLDEDGDEFWGEAEDMAVLGFYPVKAKGYFVTGAETATLPTWTVAASKDSSGVTIPGSYVVSCDTHEDNKAVLDQYYWIEEYDAVSDKWEKLSTSSVYSSSNNAYEITYSQSSYKPLRFCCGDLNKMTLTEENYAGVKLVLPTTTAKLPQKSKATNNVANVTLSTVSANKDDYMELTTATLGTVSQKANGVIEIAAPTTAPVTYYRDVKGEKAVSATEFDKYTVAEGSIKVFIKSTTSTSVAYDELAAKVSVVNEGKTIRIELDDKELSTYDKLIIIGNTGLTETYKATVEDKADSSVTLKYGTLGTASSTITKGGWKVIKGTL